MSAELPSPAEIRDSRRQNLLQKYADGHRLTEDQRREIGDLICERGAAEAPPIAPENAAPEAPPARSGEVTAAEIERWEAIYATRRRQLYRYVATGNANGDPCPLEEPAKMPGWWARNMKQRVPCKILAAAQKAARETGTPVAEAPDAEAFSAPSQDGSYQFPLQVERMRSEQQRIQAQLDKARGGSMVGAERVVNQADCESLLRQSLALTGELRKAENDLTTWLVARAELVNRAEVRAENAHIAGAIFSAVRRLVATVRPQLAGKTDAEQDALWKEKTLACFEALKDAKFNDHAAALAAP